jgi:hypothetical protein
LILENLTLYDHQRETIRGKVKEVPIGLDEFDKNIGKTEALF